MRTYRLVLLCLATSIFISGCSSRSDLVKSSFLKTHIQENNAKIFTLYLTPVNEKKSHSHTNSEGNKQNPPANGKREGKGDKQGSRSPSNKQSAAGNGTKLSSDYQDKMREVLLETLDEALQESGYCRKGYIELNRTIGKGLIKIKGECHESATPADKKIFPNDS